MDHLGARWRCGRDPSGSANSSIAARAMHSAAVSTAGMRHRHCTLPPCNAHGVQPRPAAGGGNHGTPAHWRSFAKVCYGKHSGALGQTTELLVVWLGRVIVSFCVQGSILWHLPCTSELLL